ncbi:MAG TPA: hypothetical protein VIV60_28150 [Polyangiaceae bacterium]
MQSPEFFCDTPEWARQSGTVCGVQSNCLLRGLCELEWRTSRFPLLKDFRRMSAKFTSTCRLGLVLPTVREARIGCENVGGFTLLVTEEPTTHRAFLVPGLCAPHRLTRDGSDVTDRLYCHIANVGAPFWFNGHARADPQRTLGDP